MREKIISTLISSAILLGILAAGGWFYRTEIAGWLAKRRTADAGPSDPHAGMHHGEHSGAEAQAEESRGGERKILYWYDPMHPAYKSDKPGTAPDCGMDLVPMYADESAAGSELPPGTVNIPAERQQLIGVRTARVERQRVVRRLRVTGKFTVDETRVVRVHTKFAGYVEDLFVDYVGRPVKAGEPLFTIYSPELVATQQEYLIALRGRDSLKDAPYPEVARSTESLARAARERLRQWDISEEELARLEKEGQSRRALTIYSPASGVVTERAVFPRGRYVTPEMELYTITDFSNLWLIAEVFEAELPYVRIGQEATVRLPAIPGRAYRARVSFIAPAVDLKTRTARVRLDFPNPALEVKAEMFADVELDVDYGVQTVVPRDAVLDSGTQQTVFVVRDGGYFEPRVIQPGPRLVGLPGDAAAGELVIVLSGVKPGETVVASANFLIDSESRLKSAMSATQHKH
jgi:RND family efflux transporter MFP subunit